MTENTPNIKIRTKENERPIVKVKSLPAEKKTENFAIKDDNSSASSVISYKETKSKKKKKLKEVDIFTKNKNSGSDSRFDMYANPKRKIKREIVEESEESENSEDSDDNSSEYSGSSYTGSDSGSSRSGSVSESGSESSSLSRPKMSWKEIESKKQDYLLKLHDLESKGFKLTKHFSMKSDLEDMELEYNRHKRMAEQDAAIKFSRKMLMACVTGLEYLNGRFDPFNIKLNGWSESVMENIGDYDTIFTRLAEKYAGKAEMAPELELMLSLAGSAFMFHLTQTMFGGALPGMGDIVKQNPELMSNIAKAMNQSMNNDSSPPVSNNQPSNTMNGPGIDISSFMGGLMGNNSNFSRPVSSSDIRMPPPSVNSSVNLPTPMDRPKPARTNDNYDNDRFSTISTSESESDNGSVNIVIPQKKKGGKKPKRVIDI